MDTLSYMQNDADTPVVPLPNPGEGGPVPDGEAAAESRRRRTHS